MINEEFIKTELTALASDLMKLVEEIEKRKADREERCDEADRWVPIAGPATQGLQRELNYIFGRMENVRGYLMPRDPITLV